MISNERGTLLHLPGSLPTNCLQGLKLQPIRSHTFATIMFGQFAEYGRTRRDLAHAEPFFAVCTVCNATKNSCVQPSVHGNAVVAVLCTVDSLSAELKENLAIKLIFLTQGSL